MINLDLHQIMYTSSDMMVHQRRDFFASVRLTSHRTTRPETFPTGANKAGYYQVTLGNI